MKKLLTILLILISITIKAQYSTFNFALAGTLGLLTYAAYDDCWHDSFDSENGLYTSIGLDPKMLITGDPEIDVPAGSLDNRIKLSYKYNRLNPYILCEVFSHLNFESYTTGIDYAIIDRKLGLLTGFEVGRVHNKGEKVWCYGLNLESKYWTKKRNVFFALTYNPETAFEISKKMRHNVSVSVGIKLKTKQP